MGNIEEEPTVRRPPIKFSLIVTRGGYALRQIQFDGFTQEALLYIRATFPNTNYLQETETR